MEYLFKCTCRVVFNKSKCGNREAREIWYGHVLNIVDLSDSPKMWKTIPKLLKKWHSWICRMYTEGKNQNSNSTWLLIGPFGAGQLYSNQSCSLHACTSGAILAVSTQKLNEIPTFWWQSGVNMLNDSC